MFKKILCMLMLLLSCSVAQATENILVFGDSLSAGYGIDVQQGWVPMLQQRITTTNLDYHVINASISGDTTSNGLLRLPAALAEHKPKIVILELGANDGLRGLSLQAMYNNLAEMIKLIQQADSTVLLLGLNMPPNYGQDYNKQFKAVYHNLAEKYQLAFVPAFLAGVDDDRAMIQSDNIHPNADAQSKMLENVWVQLKPMLTIS